VEVVPDLSVLRLLLEGVEGEEAERNVL